MNSQITIHDRPNIALIGARGTGKSKLAKKLSRLGAMVSMSTDNLVCYEAGGISIETIVKNQGWEAFRQREYQVLAKVASMNGIIIDCGGGILFEAPPGPGEAEVFSNRKADLLKKNAYRIYLRRSVKNLVKKAMRNDPGRPALGGDYMELLERRLPIYERECDRIIDMDDTSVDEAARQIASEIAKHRLD